MGDFLKPPHSTPDVRGKVQMGREKWTESPWGNRVYLSNREVRVVQVGLEEVGIRGRTVLWDTKWSRPWTYPQQDLIEGRLKERGKGRLLSDPHELS